MASFFHDESRLSEFARRAQERSEREHRPLSGPEVCEVDVLEWPPSKYKYNLLFLPPTHTHTYSIL